MGHSSKFSTLGQLLVAILLLATAVTAKATLLGVTPSVPDSNFSAVMVSYNAGTTTLTVSSSSYSLYRDPSDVAHTPDSGSLAISILLDTSGGTGVDQVTVASGNLTVSGDLSTAGITTGPETLLMATINDIGASIASDLNKIDLLGTITGGFLTTNGHMTVGGEVGVILNEVSNSLTPFTDFSTSFDNEFIIGTPPFLIPQGFGIGTADVTTPRADVPLPATAFLMGFGWLSLVVIRRRNKAIQG